MASGFVFSLTSQADEETIEDVMSSKVVTVDRNATVKAAASLMTKRKCSCLVVLNENAAIGIVTERDLVRKILAADVDPSKVLISDVMSTPLVTIDSSSSVLAAAEKMSEYLIRRLAVVDDRDGCDDIRVEVNVEAEGANGPGVTAPLAPDSARRLRAAIAAALREVGEDPGS